MTFGRSKTNLVPTKPAPRRSTTPVRPTRSVVAGTSRAVAAQAAYAFALGDLVEISGTKLSGKVKYIGPAHFSSGVWVGIQLPQPIGRNDGSVQGKRYFSCKQSHGMFVRANGCALVRPSGPPGHFQPSTQEDFSISFSGQNRFQQSWAVTPTSRSSLQSQRGGEYEEYEGVEESYLDASQSVNALSLGYTVDSGGNAMSTTGEILSPRTQVKKAMAGRRLGHPAASVAPPNPSVSTASYVPSNTRPMPSLSTDNTNAASPTSDTITFNNKHSAHLPVDGTPNGRGIEGDNNSLIASSVSPSRKANRPGKINPGSPVEHYLDPSSVVKLVLASPDLQMCIQSHVMRHQPPPPPPVSVIDEVTPVIEKAFQDTQALTKSRISELEGVMGDIFGELQKVSLVVEKLNVTPPPAPLNTDLLEKGRLDSDDDDDTLLSPTSLTSTELDGGTAEVRKWRHSCAQKDAHITELKTALLAASALAVKAQTFLTQSSDINSSSGDKEASTVV